MYNDFMLETQGFRNLSRGGEIIGFAVDIRIGYYRGVMLCLVGELSLEVDGIDIPRADLRLSLRGRDYSLDELAREETERWDFGERAALIGLRAGGLAPGPHQVKVSQIIRPSYAPGGGFASEVERSLTLVEGTPLPAGIELGVSLYSYQYEYFTRRMNLADCLEEVAAIGATGVQLLPEQMVPGGLNPSDEWIAWWHTQIERLGLHPTVIDTFLDDTNGGHRQISPDEALERLLHHLRLAKRLGFSAVRPTTGPMLEAAPDLLLSALPEAERLDIAIIPEIHAPVRLGGELTESYIKIIDQTGTKHLGFTLDLGIFCTQLPPVMLGQWRRRGVSEEILAFGNKEFQAHRAPAELAELVRDMGGSDVAQRFAMQTGVFGPSANTPADLASLVPYVHNVHAKFYEIGEDGEEPVIPYGPLLEVLATNGYQGSLDSEYEGQRRVQDAFEVDSAEQVRRQHALIRRDLAVASS